MWMVLVLCALGGQLEPADPEPRCPDEVALDVSIQPSVIMAEAGQTFRFQVHVGETSEGCYNNCYWVLAYDSTLMMPVGLYGDERDFCGHQWLSYGTLDDVWLDGDMHGWCSRLTYQEPPALTGCMLNFDFMAIRPGIGWIGLSNVSLGEDWWTEVWYDGQIVTDELISGVVIIDGQADTGRDTPDPVLIDLLPPEMMIATDTVEIPYKVEPVDSETAPYVGVQAYITWDPDALMLLGWAEGDHPWWDESGWPDNGAGGIINETWEDGDAFLMLFDDPFDDIVPAAPQMAFKLLFAVHDDGCVRIDEWWCPPWDPQCDQAVPLVTRICDPWARSVERVLGTTCLTVKKPVSQPPQTPSPGPDVECEHFDVSLQPESVNAHVGQTFWLGFHVDCPEAGRMACGYRQIDAAIFYDPTVLRPTDLYGANLTECGYDWQGHLGGWQVVEGAYYVWAYNLDRPPWPACGCAWQIEFEAIGAGVTEVTLCDDDLGCTHVRDMNGRDAVVSLAGARIRVVTDCDN